MLGKFGHAFIVPGDAQHDERRWKLTDVQRGQRAANQIGAAVGDHVVGQKRVRDEIGRVDAAEDQAELPDQRPVPIRPPAAIGHRDGGVAGAGGQLSADSSVADVGRLDFGKINPLAGPVFIDGAEPGDVLKVTLLSFTPSGWGWTANIPGFGLLADEFKHPALQIWRYDPSSLPVYLEWRMMGEGLYAVGMEPSTNTFGTVPELLEAGYPLMMEPGEERVYQLEFGVLAGGEEIDAFAASLPAVDSTGA